MNGLFEALQDHYAARGCILLEVLPDAYRAVNWKVFRGRWDVVLVVEAVVLDKVGDRLDKLRNAYSVDRPVLATWADGITTGDVAALEAEGVTVLALEREATYAMQDV